MITFLAHAGHSHDAATMSALDHCMPIIVGFSVLVALLLGVIGYLLVKWQPKKPVKASKKQ